MTEAQEVQQIRFHFTEKVELTWEEYEAIELAQDGNLKLYRLRPLAARFMVDKKGKPLTHAVAMRMLGRLGLASVTTVIDQFVEALSEKAIPKANGDSSKPPSEQKIQPASGSPDG